MSIEKTEVLLVRSAINTVELNHAARFIVDINPSTGYHWTVTPDNSGTYELTEILELTTSTDPIVVGAPGKAIYQFRAMRKGTGSILFQHYPPGRSEPVETFEIKISIK